MFGVEFFFVDDVDVNMPHVVMTVVLFQFEPVVGLGTLSHLIVRCSVCSACSLFAVCQYAIPQLDPELRNPSTKVPFSFAFGRDAKLSELRWA